MSGNSIGSLLGAGIGFLIGGPAGAKWGFVIGGAIGGYVDPVKIKGPRLSDAQQQTSQEGVPIPWGYGTFPTMGNIIFASDLTEHEHEARGKGGGTTNVNYTYTRSFAIGICSGPDDGSGITGLLQVKENGKLVYDASPDSEIQGENSKFLDSCTIYLGTDTQTVDPTIESIVGVNVTGPNRRLAYIVFEDKDLTEFQGAIPQYEFVVQMCGSVTSNDGGEVVGYIDVDASDNAGSTSVNGIVITAEPDQVVTLKLVAGVYSSWQERDDPLWRCRFKVEDGEGNISDHYTDCDADNSADAFALGLAQPPVQLSGSTSYTVWIFDTVLEDNGGGLSFRVTKTGAGWIEAPDAPGVFVDQDGNVVNSGVAWDQLNPCTAILSDIVDDLCKKSGIDVATEVDTSQLTDIVAGFKCATESGADGFIEALTLSHFFDRAEWDKKVRFPKRGGAVVANLTVDDLIQLDGPPIIQTRIQEPELLRKVNILSIDPAADFNVTKQSWERRAGTIQAKGEASVEIPEVVETDTAAQIAEIRGKIAWSETDKFRYGLTVKWSKLTPTDPVTLTDKLGATHRIRLADMNEELGRFMVEEAVKDRASIYTGTAQGVTNPNSPGPTSPGLIGPTVFVAMNLPQLRAEDGQGMYVGLAGMTSGWPGAQLLMSVDGGASYNSVLNVIVPTKLGPLTADLDAVGSASEPLSVHVYGGQLSSATTAQVNVGANYSAVQTLTSAGTIAEVLAYETASEVTAGYYNLSVLSRGLEETLVDDHYAGDIFMDLATSYFVPIDPQFAGTIYFKAVGIGVSADAVTAVAVEYIPRAAATGGRGDLRDLWMFQ